MDNIYITRKFSIKSGLDNKAGQIQYFVEAENGDVVIKSLMVILDLKEKRLNCCKKEHNDGGKCSN